MSALFTEKANAHTEESCAGGCCGSGEWWTQLRVRNDNFDLEANLAKEMNELSFQEREQVFEEIHGVANPADETPEFTAKCLKDFDRSLAQLFKRKRKALDRAIFLKPTILTDDDFRLLFLRADSFDPAKAANRMSRFFEQKLVLFGEDKLVKDITQDDVTKEEVELGALLIGTLSQRDQSGRPVRIGLPNKVDHSRHPLKSLLRGCWYQTMALLDEDGAASTKGICQILYASASEFRTESIPRRAHLSWQAGDLINSLPVRISSYHFCYNNRAIKMLIEAIHQGIGKHIRVRLRTHFGSPVEIQYSLLTFGIDCGSKIDSSSSESMVDTTYLDHRKLSEHRKEQKRLDQEAVSGIILYPGSKDVLIGRGHFYASHSGNKRYHVLVDSKVPAYSECNNRFQKTAIATEVITAIQESGGRFLSPIGGGWKEVDDKVARDKIAIAFRSFKKRPR